MENFKNNLRWNPIYHKWDMFTFEWKWHFELKDYSRDTESYFCQHHYRGIKRYRISQIEIESNILIKKIDFWESLRIGSIYFEFPIPMVGNEIKKMFDCYNWKYLDFSKWNNNFKNIKKTLKEANSIKIYYIEKHWLDTIRLVFDNWPNAALIDIPLLKDGNWCYFDNFIVAFQDWTKKQYDVMKIAQWFRD